MGVREVRRMAVHTPTATNLVGRFLPSGAQTSLAVGPMILS